MALQQTVSLAFTTIEDANMGMWLSGMNVKRVSWRSTMMTFGRPCCFADRNAHRSPPEGAPPAPPVDPASLRCAFAAGVHTMQQLAWSAIAS